MSVDQNVIRGFQLFIPKIPIANALGIGPGVCRDDDDNANIILEDADAPLVINPAVVGLDGIDVGALEPNTTYLVFVVRRRQEVRGLLSKGTATTPPGAVWPAGFQNAHRRIGVVRTDANANLLPFVQTGDGRDRTYRYTADLDDLRVVDGGAAPDFTAVNASALLPDRFVTGVTVFAEATNGTVELRASSSVAGATFRTRGELGDTFLDDSDFPSFRTSPGATANLYVRGFTDLI
jgi:hypothetical protein